jgi:hypothetical protein
LCFNEIGHFVVFVIQFYFRVNRGTTQYLYWVVSTTHNS